MSTKVDATPPLARLAGLLADPTRATFCLALLDGSAWTAGELARHAGVAPSTATEHLHLLVTGGLLAQERQGRHRYVRLAGPNVAELIEDMAGYADTSPPPPARSPETDASREAMARARTCHDHLAGRLGVAVTDAMASAGLLRQESGLTLTDRGLVWLASRGMDLATMRRTRRPLARGCLDWTEHRPHLAGAAGAALCRGFHERGWVVRIDNQRAVRVTPDGEQALRDLLGIRSADIA